MRAWQVDLAGEPLEVLERRDVGVPAPGPGEVRVGVAAAALGLPDVFLCRGTYAFSPAPPFIPGQEAVGLVTAVGPDVSIPLGARVMGVTKFPEGHGAFADEALMGADAAYAVPDAMDDAHAATFRIGFATAWVGLVRRAALQPGEHVLVLGAAGGSGAAAVQLAGALGAHVIAVAGGADKAAYCREIGAHEVIEHRTDDVVERVRGITDGRGVEVVFDPVGGDAGEESMRVVANEGRFLAIGFAAGRWPDVSVRHAVGRNYGVLGVYVGAYDRAASEHDHDQLMALVEQGVLRSAVERTVGFDEIPDALDEVARGRVIGKTAAVF